jgi:hypothetical protein
MSHTTDTPASIGKQADAPDSGSVTLIANGVQYPNFNLTFVLDNASVPVTDASTSGSYGALKLFDFIKGAVHFDASYQNYTAFEEGADLTGGAGDASFAIGVGTAGIAAAADGALATTSVDLGTSISVTLSGGTGTGTAVKAINAVFDGSGTAKSIYLNVSGTAATIDASSTLSVTGTVTVSGSFLPAD